MTLQCAHCRIAGVPHSSHFAILPLGCARGYIFLASIGCCERNNGQLVVIVFLKMMLFCSRQSSRFKELVVRTLSMCSLQSIDCTVSSFLHLQQSIDNQCDQENIGLCNYKCHQLVSHLQQQRLSPFLKSNIDKSYSGKNSKLKYKMFKLYSKTDMANSRTAQVTLCKIYRLDRR